jgi:hypothetical protein
LIATAYQKVHILPAYPPSKAYSPEDFASTSVLMLMRGARLKHEEFIIHSKKKHSALIRNPGDGLFRIVVDPLSLSLLLSLSLCLFFFISSLF